MLSVYKILSVVCIAAYLSVSDTDAQNLCTPQNIVNLSISFDAVLSWDHHPEEKCNITRYVIHVDNDLGTERIFIASRPSLIVDYLPVCDDYIFRVRATSEQSVDGPETRLATKIPLPANANLTVGMVKITPGEGHEVHLEWAMDDAWLKCADRFRVIIHDEDVDHFQDIYTFNTSVLIPYLSPCTSYELGVVAIYNWEIEGPVTVVRHSTPEGVLNAPRLRSIDITPTSANLTWSVENYTFNKCPVTKAEIVVINNFNFTIDILDQTDRQPFNVILTNLRPESLLLVNVTVINSAGPSNATLIALQTPRN